MDKFILGKLTGSDIGIILVATVYLIERVALLVVKILGKKQPVATVNTCPPDTLKAVAEIHVNINSLRTLLSAVDEDGRPRIYVSQSLYKNVTALNADIHELTTEIKLLKEALKD